MNISNIAYYLINRKLNKNLLVMQRVEIKRNISIIIYYQIVLYSIGYLCYEIKLMNINYFIEISV